MILAHRCTCGHLDTAHQEPGMTCAYGMVSLGKHRCGCKEPEFPAEPELVPTFSSTTGQVVHEIAEPGTRWPMSMEPGKVWPNATWLCGCTACQRRWYGQAA